MDAKDRYTINGEVSNKIVIKRGSFKYDIHDTIITLGTDSLTSSDMSFLCIIYIFMYISDIYYMYMISDTSYFILFNIYISNFKTRNK